MPLYEYECLECGRRFERLQRFGEVGPPACPNGHSQVHRILSQPAIIFKGPGFYVTDNRRGSYQGPVRHSRNGGTEKPGKIAQMEGQPTSQRDCVIARGEA